MTLEFQIVAALCLDIIIGDPSFYPHPVRLVGRLANFVERTLGKATGYSKSAGIVTTLVVLLFSGAATFALIRAATMVHPLAGDVLSCLVLYTCFSVRDLAAHALRVHGHLMASRLKSARESVGWMVGRKTDQMNEKDICRATVESVAENLVDGVTAPLLFALVGGPVAAMVYKAASTLDSMFGHRNEKYEQFGWSAARLDDLFNLLPARLTAPFIALAALFGTSSSTLAIKTVLRDGHKHASPNSGIPEAAFAGALRVQLGGASEYAHGVVYKPSLGRSLEPLAPGHIKMAIALMLRTTLLFAAFGLIIRTIFIWGRYGL